MSLECFPCKTLVSWKGDRRLCRTLQLISFNYGQLFLAGCTCQPCYHLWFLLWMLSRSLTLLLYCGAQNHTQCLGLPLGCPGTLLAHAEPVVTYAPDPSLLSCSSATHLHLCLCPVWLHPGTELVFVLDYFILLLIAQCSILPRSPAKPLIFQDS